MEEVRYANIKEVRQIVHMLRNRAARLRTARPKEWSFEAAILMYAAECVERGDFYKEVLPDDDKPAGNVT